MSVSFGTAELMSVAATLGWASGLRLYAVLFLTGLAGRCAGMGRDEQAASATDRSARGSKAWRVAIIGDMTGE